MDCPADTKVESVDHLLLPVSPGVLADGTTCLYYPLIPVKAMPCTK